MKYVCLVYNDEAKLAALSQAELDALVRDCIGWVADLERGGHHVMSIGLQSFRTASTLRHRGGAISTTDGPFAETKEHLGGLTLLEARDLNEAIHLASRLPATRVGSVEVRPVLDASLPLIDPADRRIATAIRQHTADLEPAAAARMLSAPQPGPSSTRSSS
jgi:hypothetical protein